MLEYYYTVICAIIKALAANDETMHSVAKIGFVAACSLGILPSHWGEIVLRRHNGNLRLVSKKRLARISAWGLSYQVK